MKSPFRSAAEKDRFVKTLAILGAIDRLTRIDQEREILVGLFPELDERNAEAGEVVRTVRTGTATKKTSAKRKWTAAQKEKVRRRMKKFWAAKRKAQKEKESVKRVKRFIRKSAKKAGQKSVAS